MRYTGEVYYLQPELDEPAGKGYRPHVLLNDCVAEAEFATLAYGSRSDNDALFGAEHVVVDPREGDNRYTGLRQTTYIYTSRLVASPLQSMDQSAGRLIDQLPAVRASLARSLGLGTGVTGEANRVGANRRGRLVELTEDLADEWQVRHALIVTEPFYSRHGFQQTVLPLLGDSFESFETDVKVGDAAWLQHLQGDYRNAFFATSMISTLYAPDHIKQFLDIAVTPLLMTDLERELVMYFDL